VKSDCGSSPTQRALGSPLNLRAISANSAPASLGVLRPFVLAQHSQNYLTATALGGTRYATMSAAGKKNKLKMKYPMKL
jgi:hypothetical protein